MTGISQLDSVHGKGADGIGKPANFGLSKLGAKIESVGLRRAGLGSGHISVAFCKSPFEGLWPLARRGLARQGPR